MSVAQSDPPTSRVSVTLYTHAALPDLQFTMALVSYCLHSASWVWIPCGTRLFCSLLCLEPMRSVYDNWMCAYLDQSTLQKWISKKLVSLHLCYKTQPHSKFVSLPWIARHGSVVDSVWSLSSILLNQLTETNRALASKNILFAI